MTCHGLYDDTFQFDVAIGTSLIQHSLSLGRNCTVFFNGGVWNVLFVNSSLG